MTFKLSLFVFSCFAIPFGLDLFKDKYKIIKKISVVVLCYILGLLIGNVFFQDFSHEDVATPLFEACVALSIPLLLIQSKIISFIKESKQVVFSFIISLSSVVFMTILTFILYQGKIENLWQVCGMLIGVYTGGSPNMSAIAIALEVDPTLFIKMNALDLLGGGLMIFLILSVFVPLGMKFLSKTNLNKDECFNYDNLHESRGPLKQRLINFILFLVLAVLALGIAFGLSQLFFGKLNFIFFICISSVLGIGLSFHKKLSQQCESFLLGQYLLYVFCFTMGSLANINKLVQSLDNLFIVVAIVLFGSLFLHLFICFLCKIPFETAIITSTACLFGPPFIGPVAERLNNQKLLIAGITTGLFGYSIGTFLGVSLALMLKNYG
ncbi:DUF819 family protein [Bacteriovoracaceae bacterium]|nr:DUF819 family protein [Bacteriovoracaceae bacterium]